MPFKKSLLLFLFALTVFTSFTLVDKWHVSVSKTFGYKIEFPQKPEETVQEIDSEIGKLKLNLSTYEVTEKSPADENLLYLINCTVFADTLVSSDNTALIEGFFRGTIDGANNEIGGKILSEEPITIEGFPGREVKISFNEGADIITMRLYLVKNKLFMLETITHANKITNAAITRFLNSFQLI